MKCSATSAVSSYQKRHVFRSCVGVTQEIKKDPLARSLQAERGTSLSEQTEELKVSSYDSFTHTHKKSAKDPVLQRLPPVWLSPTRDWPPGTKAELSSRAACRSWHTGARPQDVPVLWPVTNAPGLRAGLRGSAGSVLHVPITTQAERAKRALARLATARSASPTRVLILISKNLCFKIDWFEELSYCKYTKCSRSHHCIARKA